MLNKRIFGELVIRIVVLSWGEKVGMEAVLLLMGLEWVLVCVIKSAEIISSCQRCGKDSWGALKPMTWLGKKKVG